MKTSIAQIATLVAALSTFVAVTKTANAESIVEGRNYKEIYVNFKDAEKIKVIVQGPRYRATQARTLVDIKAAGEGLYIVEQENLYYTMPAIHSPLHEVTMRDGASIDIEKGELSSVRILVPQGLELTAEAYRDPSGLTCMAFWTGFIYDASSDSCVSIGSSGCGNPFEFHSLVACKRANLLK